MDKVDIVKTIFERILVDDGQGRHRANHKNRILVDDGYGRHRENHIRTFVSRRWTKEVS